MKTKLISLLIIVLTASVLLISCKGDNSETSKSESDEVTKEIKELPDTLNIEGDNIKITTEGMKVRLIVCDCKVIATDIKPDCSDHNYSIGDKITQSCYAETDCPCNGLRWLVFNDGCRIKAENIKDCYPRWFD